MGRPPLGTRWGDLSPEQRAALPVGTRLLAFDGIPELTRTDWGGWVDGHGVVYYSPSPHQRIAYPDPLHAPDPRDSDGPGCDEDGGEMRPP